MKRRQFVLLLGAGGAAASSVGSGAFSSVEAERGVEVNIAEDESAYLGMEQVGSHLPADTDGVQATNKYKRTAVLRIKNQFSHPLDLTTAVRSTKGVVSEVTIDTVLKNKGDDHALGIGDEAYIAAGCDDTGHGRIKLFFDGEAGGTTVEQTRQFNISCVNVDFNGENGKGDNNKGGGAVHISGEFDGLEVKINPGNRTETITSKNGKKVLTPNGGQINSVTIDGNVYKRDEDTSATSGANQGNTEKKSQNGKGSEGKAKNQNDNGSNDNDSGSEGRGSTG